MDIDIDRYILVYIDRYKDKDRSIDRQMYRQVDGCKYIGRQTNRRQTGAQVDRMQK